MNRTVFIDTWKNLIRNPKNRLAFFAICIAIIAYSIFFVPQKKTFDTIDTERLALEVQSNKGLMEEAMRKGNYKVNGFTGQSAFVQAKRNYEYQQALLESIQSGNAQRYTQILRLYMPPFYIDEMMEQYATTSEFPEKDRSYDSTNFFNRLDSYVQSDLPLSFSLIHERTAWQQFQRFVSDSAPLALVVFVLFIASDVTTLAIKKRTLHIGEPVGWGRTLLTQSVATATFILSCLAIFTLVFFVVNSILYGSGSPSLQIENFVYSDDLGWNPEMYQLKEIGTYIIQTLPFALLLLIVFIRLSVLFSLLFKQEVVVFLAGLFVFLFEQLYFSRRTRDLFGIDVSYFPQTYFDFGKISTGEKNFLINTDTLSVERGLLVVGIAWLFVELLLLFTTRIQTRQRFIGKG